MKHKIILSVFLLINTLAESALASGAATRALSIPAACVPPAYPETSIRFGEAPVVALDFLINANGAVLKAKVVQTSGAKIFDDAARAALSRCTYPALNVSGKSVGGWIRVRHKWILE